MEERKNKVTIKGWISLIILVMILSGAFKDVAGPLAAFDFNNLMGKFGTIVDGIDFTGKNGSGVRDGSHCYVQYCLAGHSSEPGRYESSWYYLQADSQAAGWHSWRGRTGLCQFFHRI